MIWTVAPEEDGFRLDRALPAHLEHASRSRSKRWIEEGRVKVSGRPARPSRRLRRGETVEVNLPPPEPAEPAAEEIPLDILFEDEELLVLNKPAGLVVHPAPGHRTGTLVNALLFHCRGGGLSGVGGVLRPGIVHRLDRGTSGVLVVAKNDAAHLELSRQFAGRSVEKRYLALVRGRTPARLRIETAIGRDLRDRKKISTRSRRARSAITCAERLEELPGSTLLSVRIATGRTHQIRVHLASAGHPVVGDRVYGGAGDGPEGASRLLRAFPRPALHAAGLAFDHPRTGERLSFEAPLPRDLTGLLEALRRAPRR